MLGTGILIVFGAMAGLLGDSLVFHSCKKDNALKDKLRVY